MGQGWCGAPKGGEKRRRQKRLGAAQGAVAHLLRAGTAYLWPVLGRPFLSNGIALS